MNASRVKAQTHGQNKGSVSSEQQQRASRTNRSNRVLAERNQAVAAVGAWVEDGHDFEQHPSTLASITEKLQTERRRQNEESLRRFQNDVRHRVALQTQLLKKRQQLQSGLVVKPGRRISEHLDVKSQHVPLGDAVMSQGVTAKHKLLQQSYEEAGEGTRLIRHKLAACRHRETASDLPGGNWNMSPNRHKSAHHVVWTEQEVEDDTYTMEEGGCLDFSRQHKCPLVQQRDRRHVTWDSDKLQPDSESSLKPTKILWPMNDQEELKRQWQSRFWMKRRQFMDHEREQVKENMQHRRHLKRTERIKAEKEQIRLEEEKKLEGARQLAAARHMLEERELLILERLKLEEEERAAELQRTKKEEKQKETSRYVDALRAQAKERLSQEKVELPPLCCCASSFWDSHPDTCANNCVFYNNPKAYAQALHSAMMGLGFQ
ncbi:coiled-coil domain-containing protein 15 isoform X2 [Cynoglossus semilaevis]|uniref:Coiled-coil domain-containing protein 15 n=1 Tax=Cynoglossus semilaevis TaxID=244447 RepID=A0A3P8WW08_CYNSE|nr:coiled-coil domain-containing protein 15 isoform X2 [Cynoglossus semilaevis]